MTFIHHTAPSILAIVMIGLVPASTAAQLALPDGSTQAADRTGAAPGSPAASGYSILPRDRWDPLVAHCAAAERFLIEDRRMVAVTEPDTIDDWRTQQDVPGCRVTAAGTTTLFLETAAKLFYRQLRAAGWTRTPDPIDAPGEASLRFRMGETDCLFNVYSGIHLGTMAEIKVSTAMVPGPGETRLNVLVLCTPAMEAAAKWEPSERTGATPRRSGTDRSGSGTDRPGTGRPRTDRL